MKSTLSAAAGGAVLSLFTGRIVDLVIIGGVATWAYFAKPEKP